MNVPLTLWMAVDTSVKNRPESCGYTHKRYDIAIALRMETVQEEEEKDEAVEEITDPAIASDHDPVSSES